MKNKYVILRHLGDMCLFTPALRALVNKSHIPPLPQNNLYVILAQPQCANYRNLMFEQSYYFIGYVQISSKVTFNIASVITPYHPPPPPFFSFEFTMLNLPVLFKAINNTRINVLSLNKQDMLPDFNVLKI